MKILMVIVLIGGGSTLKNKHGCQSIKIKILSLKSKFKFKLE